ncbi:Phosphomethylpyrimidine kinase-domain-containing protein [Gymnopilus junonius]|uniref:Phosphomethylpyrimidine kinase-domain-containing protein n=1 Tax=Gymnopilus junonius TaxID=109634 RepID=A0A9P5N9P4_GYMJU|nr:Phosphomethylpyrimidine kinase-domain-containing protein [Gymnopilus junonius]
MSKPVVLTIAGSDPSGGAGIQARDLKTFAAHRCYGASVITALTAQNTTGVQGVHPCPPEFVVQQLDSVFEDLDVRVIKTGMLHSSDITSVVVETLSKHYERIPAIICDPVCVSTSGHTLLDEDGLLVLKTSLIPLSLLITPNKSEAELLLSSVQGEGTKIHDLESMFTGAVRLLDLNPQAVLLKGGHVTVHMKDVIAVQEKFEAEGINLTVVKQNLLGENMEILSAFSDDLSDLELAVDVLVEKADNRRAMFVRPRIDSSSTHGTGCTLSSAIASELANGSHSLTKAVEKATMYTYLAIQSAVPIGEGHGPLNHLHNIRHSLIPHRMPKHLYPFTHMLINSCATSWKEYVEHDFVRQLGQGTLDRARFIHFIKQDYIYLKYYARAYGLLSAKSTSWGAIQSSTQTILNILHEIENHKASCLNFHITEGELDRTPEAAATTAYGAFILDIGLQGDANKLTMALMACLLGYGEVGLWLVKESRLPGTWVVQQDNPYWYWAQEYSGEMYQSAVKIGLETIELMAQADPPNKARLKEWIGVWEKCTRLEKGFWDMAMELKY